jgi:hypothetical protein
MPAVIETRGSQTAAQAPSPKLNEAVWQAWIAKGRRLDTRRARTRLETVKLLSALGLLAGAGLWSYVASYEVMFRFAATMASCFVMLHAIRSRHYALAGLFGAVALLFNPLAQLFSASDDLKRVLLAIGATPFIVSLGWRDTEKHHE